MSSFDRDTEIEHQLELTVNAHPVRRPRLRVGRLAK